MIKRRAFYSFHFAADSWRAATVRNIGLVEGNRPATDNDWEAVARGVEAAISARINQQMNHRSCTPVLVGAHTAGRRWIDYEISRSWTLRKGLAGIRNHGLMDSFGNASPAGGNPFGHFTVPNHHGYSQPLAPVVQCFDPPGNDSVQRYNWIRVNLADIVEAAIWIRSQYP